MSFTEIVKIKDIKLKDAILLEGLPGVGNVGKLAAMHLIEELKAKKCTEIYSSHFPPQVLIDDDGVVKLVNNELYYHKGKGKIEIYCSWLENIKEWTPQVNMSYVIS